MRTKGGRIPLLTKAVKPIILATFECEYIEYNHSIVGSIQTRPITGNAFEGTPPLLGKTE